MYATYRTDKVDSHHLDLSVPGKVTFTILSRYHTDNGLSASLNMAVVDRRCTTVSITPDGKLLFDVTEEPVMTPEEQLNCIGQHRRMMAKRGKPVSMDRAQWCIVHQLERKHSSVAAAETGAAGGGGGSGGALAPQVTKLHELLGLKGSKAGDHEHAKAASMGR